MADNEPAASSTSSSATVAPSPPETRRWADVADEAEAEAEAESSSVNLDSLAIDESRQRSTGLTDPDDARIEAVILST